MERTYSSFNAFTKLCEAVFLYRSIMPETIMEMLKKAYSELETHLHDVSEEEREYALTQLCEEYMALRDVMAETVCSYNEKRKNALSYVLLKKIQISVVLKLAVFFFASRFTPVNFHIQTVIISKYLQFPHRSLAPPL